MTADRELLKLAAKAVGMRWIDDCRSGLTIQRPDGDGVYNFHWNPLSDDGDALQLGSELGIELVVHGGADKGAPGTVSARADSGWAWVVEAYAGGGRLPSVRRTIVRAAAEIGKAMP